MDGRTDISPLYIIRSTLGSRPKNDGNMQKTYHHSVMHATMVSTAHTTVVHMCMVHSTMIHVIVVTISVIHVTVLNQCWTDALKSTHGIRLPVSNSSYTAL